MKIDSGFDSALSASQPSAVQPAPGESFQSVLARAGQDAGASSASAEAPTPPQKKSKAEAAWETHQALRQELTDYLKKTPAQHMRDAIMKEMGLTEADLAAMPPEKREAVEADISKKIKERLLAKDQAHPDATTLQQSTAATLTGGTPASTSGQSPAGMPAYAALQASVNGTRNAG